MTTNIGKRRRVRAIPALRENVAPFVFTRKIAPVYSEVYDTYWRFACERQAIFFRRLDGNSARLTDDPILGTYRFTNAYRASDRVSQYLIRNVLYGDGKFSADDTLFRALIFKFFNKIETWNLLNAQTGGVRWSTYSFRAYDTILTRAMDAGQRIYSAAYIMPACIALSSGRKHRGHLRLIEKIVQDNVAAKMREALDVDQVFKLLREYPMLGDFLAYQYAIDLNYGPFMDCSEEKFVMPGPGARDGLRKVFSDPGEYSGADLVRWMCDHQEEEFSRRGLPFKSLWGRRLQLIDCQNLFCEVDKYSRVYHPSVAGISGRTRIKQKHRPAGPVPRPWYPPKWGLNSSIELALPAISLDEPLFAVISA